MLTNVDDSGKSIEDEMPVKTNKDGDDKRAKSISLKPVKISQAATDGAPSIELTDFDISTFDKALYTSIEDYYESSLKPLVAQLDYKEHHLRVHTADKAYWYDADRETIVEESKGSIRNLGCGKIVIKASLKKASKTKPATIEITAELTPDYQKDYEIIPYSPRADENQQHIAQFMARYITKPFEYLDNVIGAEINFNKVFYRPEKLRDVADITADLAMLENELKQLEKNLNV